MKVLIDNGHGNNTAGKRSPDSALLEYKWNREVADRVFVALKVLGVDAKLIVPELKDVSLTERVRRVNAWCEELGKSDVCLVSIHVNAAGNGREWMSARGWSAWTSVGQTKGDRLADCLYDAAEAEFKDMKIRRDLTDGDRDCESDFTILKKSKCAAALVENFFMDNKEDCAFLLSDEGKQRCANVIVKGISEFINL